MNLKYSGDWRLDLTGEDLRTLSAIARDTLTWSVKKAAGKFEMSGYPITPAIRSCLASFVTLRRHNKLRGCVGSLRGEIPLYLSIHQNTVNAALRDSRFQPLQPEELSNTELTISILSPLYGAASPDDFQIGKHGIVLHKAGKSAVFLPCVAEEQKWSKEKTLRQLSLKAGLSEHAWETNAVFELFESLTFTPL